MRILSLFAVLLFGCAAFGIESGLPAGAAVPVFNPQHVGGPLKDNACPT
jgi:hypothetical protein